MEVHDNVWYVPGEYDRAHMAVDGDKLNAWVTRIRENGLIDVVLGDDTGLGHIRTSVKLDAPGQKAEGFIQVKVT